METFDELYARQDGVHAEHGTDHGPQRVAAVERDLSDPEPFVTELSAQTRFFEAQGEAWVRIGTHKRRLKIRSVSKDAMDQAQLALQGGKLPQTWDSKKNDWVNNFDHPRFIKYALALAYIKAVLGLAESTLRNREGVIVWQSNGEIQDLPAAIQALKDMGITQTQVDALSKAIDGLTQLEQEQDVETFLGP